MVLTWLLMFAFTTQAFQFGRKALHNSFIMHPGRLGVAFFGSQEGADGGRLPTIALTKEEEELFGILRSVVDDEALETTLRVAGGWVRDKLLGEEGPKDIDIALDTMSGVAFAQALEKWSTKNNHGQLKWGVIRSNPDKSKHLETATVTIGNFDLDFVNLRTEKYADDSRIPTIEIGTALEDATRRDLTINSLFYNVRWGVVEDFTGRGIADLNARVVDTPLEPLVTLKDDPLRALRIVRFASRLGFDIAPHVFTACRDKVVTEGLATKVAYPTLP